MTDSKIQQDWLVCHSLKEWHDWLAENHASKMPVWLKIKKAGSGGAGVLLSEAVKEAICFGWIDGQMRSLGEEGYIVRFTQRRPHSIWSQINRKRAEELIAAGRMTEAGMKAVREAQSNGRWQAAYTSKEKPEMPEDLEAALKAEPQAMENFQNWRNSDQLQVVVWIKEAKRTETRRNRICKAASAARENKVWFR